MNQIPLHATKGTGKHSATHTHVVISVLETLIPVGVAVIILTLAVAAFLAGGK